MDAMIATRTSSERKSIKPSESKAPTILITAPAISGSNNKDNNSNMSASFGLDAEFPDDLASDEEDREDEKEKKKEKPKKPLFSLNPTKIITAPAGMVAKGVKGTGKVMNATGSLTGKVMNKTGSLMYTGVNASLSGAGTVVRGTSSLMYTGVNASISTVGAGIKTVGDGLGLSNHSQKPYKQQDDQVRRFFDADSESSNSLDTFFVDRDSESVQLKPTADKKEEGLVDSSLMPDLDDEDDEEEGPLDLWLTKGNNKEGDEDKEEDEENQTASTGLTKPRRRRRTSSVPNRRRGSRRSIGHCGSVGAGDADSEVRPRRERSSRIVNSGSLGSLPLDGGSDAEGETRPRRNRSVRGSQVFDSGEDAARPKRERSTRATRTIELDAPPDAPPIHRSNSRSSLDAPPIRRSNSRTSLDARPRNQRRNSNRNLNLERRISNRSLELGDTAERKPRRASKASLDGADSAHDRIPRRNRSSSNLSQRKQDPQQPSTDVQPPLSRNSSIGSDSKAIPRGRIKRNNSGRRLASNMLDKPEWNSKEVRPLTRHSTFGSDATSMARRMQRHMSVSTIDGESLNSRLDNQFTSELKASKSFNRLKGNAEPDMGVRRHLSANAAGLAMMKLVADASGFTDSKNPRGSMRSSFGDDGDHKKSADGRPRRSLRSSIGCDGDAFGFDKGHSARQKISAGNLLDSLGPLAPLTPHPGHSNPKTSADEGEAEEEESIASRSCDPPNLSCKPSSDNGRRSKSKSDRKEREERRRTNKSRSPTRNREQEQSEKDMTAPAAAKEDESLPDLADDGATTGESEDQVSTSIPVTISVEKLDRACKSNDSGLTAMETSASVTTPEEDQLDDMTPVPTLEEQRYWKCSCGEVNEKVFKFCGMCRASQLWTCGDCDFALNKCRFGYCGACASAKNVAISSILGSL